MGVALITPFKEDESVDYDALLRLVDYQLQNGTDYLVVLGTTAETPTLTEDEKKQIIEIVVSRVNGRIPIILGEGGNNTRAIVDKLKKNNYEGIDGILSVVPYYNKPSQEGIYQHYKGQLYQVLHVATHSETEEKLVVYQCLYGDYSIWVRPLAMFTETVMLEDDREVERFKLIQEV